MDTLERWRLILGATADTENDIPLEAEAAGMDAALQALYDSDRQGGLGSSSPNVNRWLGDIRKYFPASMVQVMQRDALERLGLNRMLLEPELLAETEADVHLVGVLLSLSKVMPEKTRATARMVVEKVVENIKKRLQLPLIQAVKQALNRQSRTRRPRLRDIDWHRTIRQNLRHYQPDLKAIIPERISGYGRQGRGFYHIILLLDQSGSMAESVVFSGVFGSALASLPALRVRLIAFDTAVVDLSEHLHDPVELLFGTQLGGGTDINKALAYAEGQITVPQKTLVLLISDLFEGGNRNQMLQRAAAIRRSGAKMIVLPALSDSGAPAFDRDNAAALAAMDIPVFTCTPDQFPELLAQVMG